MMAEPDTVEGEKLDILVTLVEAYEAKHFPMGLADDLMGYDRVVFAPLDPERYTRPS